MTIQNDNYNNILTAYKPRPWGEELRSGDVQGYTRPDPTSKTNLPSNESLRSGTGSSVIPWN